MTNLHIHSITLYNFKSFKGLHTIQPLDPFFNVIAGSNGSGKSNIIDSILFVLGYTAKSLRHKIITDVIYQNETQLDTCYVEILFRHTEDLVIRRELKNKKSTYTINNKIVNPAEIHTILKTYNIDNSRFLILQGEIESISMMKPKNGMLNYLEEIIGTNKYENEIAMLTDEYEKMNTMYDSKTTNFKFYEKEFNMLKNENEENINALNMHIERMRAKLEIDDYKKQLCGMENKRYIKELKTTTQLLKDLENKNMASKKEMSKCEEKLATKRTELGKADSDLQKKRKVYIGIDTQNALYEDKKGKLEKNIEKLNTEINNRENENKQKERERELITKELEEKQASIKEMTKEANLHKKEIEKNESKKLKLPEYKKLKNLEKEFLGHNSKKTEIENKIYEYNENTKALETLKAQKASYKENKGKEDELAKLTKNQNKVREEINSIDKKLTHKQSELQREMYKLNEFTKNESANKKSIKLNSLLKQVEGFIGRLGDLGSAKEELDIAISTAGKGILNYVVVKDTETAEKCIDILKRNNIERTSFIACDKISDYKLKGNFDYLINHIECEERYKKLFYFAISDTILCKDINEATKIAMGKEARKAVTLDGNMIEKSGLMSGGGAVSGGMKIQNDKKCATEKIIQKLEIEVKSLTEEKESLIAKLNALSIEIADLSNQVKFIDIKLVDQKIKKLESELKTVKIKEFESGLQKLNDKIDIMKKEMTEAETYLESLDSMQIKQLKGDVSILFEKISLYENRIAELNRKLANLKLQDIKHFESLILECKKEIKQLKKPENYEKCKEEIKKLESSRNKIVEEVNEMSVTIKEIRSKIGADFDKEIEYRNCIDEINECIVKNKKSIEQIDKERKIFTEEVKSYVSIGEIKKIEKAENIEDFDILKETILRLEQKHANVLKSSSNQFNVNAMKDFVNKNKEFSLFKKDYNSFVDELTKRKEKIDSVTKQRLDELTAGLQTINKHLKETYQLITFGGNAELESVDTLDPFSEGIILSVMPPKKSWKNVNMLSGGEKTLSSLALVFALHAYKPSCFYVMDEIDAALDNRNVSVIANYIYEKAKNAQFLIVSLRNNMFELSETIVGVFKNNGLSQTLLFDTKNIKMNVN